MASARSPQQQIGEQVADLLEQLAATAGPEVQGTADALVRSLVEFYGAAFARALAVLADAPGGVDPVRLLAQDDLVGAVLILHDLHPDDTMTRVRRALDEVRPYLGSHAGDVDVLGLEPGEDGATLRLALRGSCDGCPSSAQTVRWTIEESLARLAPEVAHVHVDGAEAGAGARAAAAEPGPALLQIGPRPPDAGAAGGFSSAVAAEAAEAADGPAEWHELRGPAPQRPGEKAVRSVAGVPLLLIRTGSGLYAYRDHCPACGGRLGAALLEGGRGQEAVLHCPACAAAYDVRHAGRGTRDRHLEPVPLLEKDRVVRVALPRVLEGAP